MEVGGCIIQSVCWEQELQVGWVEEMLRLRFRRGVGFGSRFVGVSVVMIVVVVMVVVCSDYGGCGYDCSGCDGCGCCVVDTGVGGT